jgi:hypothetical protein
MMRLRTRKDSLTTIAISFRMHWVKYLPGGGRSHAMTEKNQENHPHMRKFKLTREFLRKCISMYSEEECHSLGNFRLEIVVERRRVCFYSRWCSKMHNLETGTIVTCK